MAGKTLKERINKLQSEINFLIKEQSRIEKILNCLLKFKHRGDKEIVNLNSYYVSVVHKTDYLNIKQSYLIKQLETKLQKEKLKKSPIHIWLKH